MGRIIVSEFISVDGVVEDPGGAEGYKHGGWTFKFNRGSDGDKFKMDEVMGSEALLLGRVTYEGFAAAWPSRVETHSRTSSTACPSTLCPRPSRRLTGTTPRSSKATW